MTSPDLDALLAAHASHLSLQDDGRVKCKLTGHVLPGKAEAVGAYICGARFQRRSAEAAALASLLATTIPPGLLTPSRNFPGRLFCSFTCHLVNAKPAAVSAHLAGKKLATARKAVAAGEFEPFSEPDLPAEEEEEEEEEEGDGEGSGGEPAGPGPVCEEEEDAPLPPRRGERTGAKAAGGPAAPAPTPAAAAAAKKEKKAAAAPARPPPKGKAGPPTPAVMEEAPGGGGGRADKARSARPSRPKRVKRG